MSSCGVRHEGALLWSADGEGQDHLYEILGSFQRQSLESAPKTAWGAVGLGNARIGSAPERRRLGNGPTGLAPVAGPQPRDGATRAVKATAKLFDHDNCQTTQKAPCFAERNAPVAERSPTGSQWCLHRWPSGRITYSAGTVAANGVGRVLSRWSASASRRGQMTLPHRSSPGKRTLQ